MSEPTSEPARPAARVRRGQVVGYTFTDPIFQTDLDGIGVVLDVEGDGGNVVIRPLSDHTLYVAPENVAPVSAGDVSAG